MNDPKKKKQTDSTTDFFLQFVKEEKSEKEKTEAKKGEREQPRSSVKVPKLMLSGKRGGIA